MIRRGTIVVLFALAVAAATAVVWRVASEQGMRQLAARGEADLALASDRLVGQLQRYRDLAVVMADHPQVVDILRRGGPVVADTALLREVADQTAALDVMVIARSGDVLASAANGQGALGAQSYVQRALNGALGRGYGSIGGRSYFNAAPVFGSGGGVLGALLVSTDLRGIDYSWRGDTPAVFFTDGQGRVQVSNRSELLYWQRPDGAPGLQPPDGAQTDFDVRMQGGFEIWRLGWGRYLPGEALHLAQDVPVIGMRGEALLDVAPVRSLALSQAAAVAALLLAFGALLFLATERRRTLARANAELEARVIKRTRALREINAELRREAAEREEAQDALAQAQSELVQASKLSALGQMSAGISHELNQPLMAIRSFAENGVQFLERGNTGKAGENLVRIADMARRMGRIIKNLRAFSKQETVQQTRVEIGAVLEAVLDMTKTRREEMGVTLDYTAPIHPVWVRGGEVRLGQVFVNLVTNALDAMADQSERALRIIVETGERVTVSVADCGPGINAPEQMFDPFYSTKEVGAAKGLGLGLSISYAIVHSLGGEIRGANIGTGAEFTVSLLPMTEEMAA
ncbi:ATP-binding protein [Sulfitobacter sp. S190]|uniref:sensor histidine kinase n=1 Tax=Sulfitobacter sp. S190 TaxID=2867022 RepID=UPI0021A7858E|nr:ATP-binding protein [Sulfitobacter sp. S190]UWR20981.1 sensor histidine kinase [Sulfitobacter sp. S190]